MTLLLDTYKQTKQNCSYPLAIRQKKKKSQMIRALFDPMSPLFILIQPSHNPENNRILPSNNDHRYEQRSYNP